MTESPKSNEQIVIQKVRREVKYMRLEIVIPLVGAAVGLGFFSGHLTAKIDQEKAQGQPPELIIRLNPKSVEPSPMPTPVVRPRPVQSTSPRPQPKPPVLPSESQRVRGTVHRFIGNASWFSNDRRVSITLLSIEPTSPPRAVINVVDVAGTHRAFSRMSGDSIPVVTVEGKKEIRITNIFPDTNSVDIDVSSI